MLTNKRYSLKNPSGQRPGDFCLRLLAGFLFLLVSVPAFSQAKMEIKEPKKNFGTVEKGEVVKVEYEVRNAGNEPLLISEYEVACSCTSVDFPIQPILPGQEVKVTVTFNTKTVYDRQDRIVQLHSNDPESPTKIRFKGFVHHKK